MKFIHTADWQIGKTYGRHSSDFPPTEDQKQKFIDFRFKTIEKIIKEAKNNEVDFVLIAGDLFDRKYDKLMEIDTSVVDRTIKLLNDFNPIKVFILPGNHDYYDENSIWEKNIWKEGIGKNIHLFKENEAPFNLKENGIEVDLPTIIYPCPFFQYDPPNDLTEWIPRARIEHSDKFEIALAHGWIDAIEDSGAAPISTNNLIDVNYAALGDQHGFDINDKIPYEHIRYSGTPEQCNIAEKNPGKIILVEAKNTSEINSIKPIEVSSLNWISTKENQIDLRTLSSDLDSFEKKLMDEIKKDLKKPESESLLKLEFKNNKSLIDEDEDKYETVKDKLKELKEKLEKEFFIFHYVEPKIIKKRILHGEFANWETMIRKKLGENIPNIEPLDNEEISVTEYIIEEAISKFHETISNFYEKDN